MNRKHNQVTVERILQNINSFLEHEGYRKERLAKKMGKSPSTFYAYLQGRYPNAIYKFAAELAEMLGYKSTYFMDENFQLKPEREPVRKFAFSAGKLSETGREGLEQLAKLCELIEIYDFKGGEGYAGTDR